MLALRRRAEGALSPETSSGFREMIKNGQAGRFFAIVLRKPEASLL